MRPHLAHINNDLIKKQLAEEALNKEAAYDKYNKQVDLALEKGFTVKEIVKELEAEAERIRRDEKEGDHLFLMGVRNVKTACLSAIEETILELEGKI